MRKPLGPNIKPRSRVQGEMPMSSDEIIKREEELGNWRSAISLTFNGFLLGAITQEHAGSHIKNVAPFLGLFVTISVFVVSLISCKVKNDELEKMGAHDKYYYPKQFFGPYIFSSFLLIIFWIGYVSLVLFSAR